MWLRNKKTGGLFNTDDINKKSFGVRNYDIYNQSPEVIKEINSKSFFLAKNYNEVLEDYENNPGSDWYISVIKQAQEDIERKKEMQQKKQEEIEYKRYKRELNKLRESHSTRVDYIEYLYNQVKKYEEKNK